MEKTSKTKNDKLKRQAHGAQLEDAVMDGNLERIRWHLDGGISPDWRSNQFGDLVATAVECSQFGSLSLLLEAGAKADASNADGIGALSLAAAMGRIDCARALVEHGASLEGWVREPKWDILERSPARAACAEGHADMLKWLIEWGADVKKVDHHGRTLLMIAAKYGHGDCARVCISHGVDVDAQDTLDGSTAAMFALEHGGSDGGSGAMLALCEAGFDTRVLSRHGYGVDDLAAENPGKTNSVMYRAWRLSSHEREAFKKASEGGKKKDQQTPRL